MGANYDLLIARAPGKTDLSKHVADFLSGRGLRLDTVGPLPAVDIKDDRAVLIGPASNGRIQAAANCSGLGIEMAAWFDRNPLALHLSTCVEYCIHAWSLDSGFVAGYAVYSDGQKSGGDSVFCRSAKATGFLMPGVPTPATQNQQVLRALVGTEHDFAADLARHVNLEIGLAAFAARLGFRVHLVDFHDAVGDKVGVAVLDGKYQSVDLVDWTAVLFGARP